MAVELVNNLKDIQLKALSCSDSSYVNPLFISDSPDSSPPPKVLKLWYVHDSVTYNKPMNFIFLYETAIRYGKHWTQYTAFTEGIIGMQWIII